MAKKAEKAAPQVETVSKKYELMFILQPELLQSAVEKKLKEIEKFIEENKGMVDMKDVLGKKPFAYRIGKYDEGIYVVYNLSLPTSFNAELDEYLRIEKDVIRFLLVSLSEDYAYQKYDDVAMVKPAMKAEDKKEDKKKTDVAHKADDGGKKAEVKDKGKKADAASLDDKLDKILEGEDINM